MEKDQLHTSVTKQAGIYAGKEGYDIQVKNNTRLKGAVIDSQAEKEKNKLTTGTLTWENIDNKAEYKTGGTRNILQRENRKRRQERSLRLPGQITDRGKTG